MNILYLSAFFPSPHADSAGVLDAYHLLREMSKWHEITLLTFASVEDKQYIPCLENICREVVAVEAPALPRSYRYYLYTALSFASKLPAIARMSYSKKMVQALRELLERREFDLAHVEFTQMAHYVEYLSGVPALLDESDVAFVRRERFAKSNNSLTTRTLLGWDTRKLKKYEINYCGRFEGILVRTEPDRKVLKKYLPDARIEVVPPWVDLSFADAVSDAAVELNLLFYGAMWRHANEQAALHFVSVILPRIRAKLPAVGFTILGSRPGERLLRVREHNVVVTGYVADIVPYYHRSSVVVVPLLSGAGIKGKVVQALACGRPVVTTSVGAEGIPATEREGLFIHDDPQQFAECVVWLLQERRYLNYSEPARQFVRRFYDWKTGIKCLQMLYDETAEKSSLRGASQCRVSMRIAPIVRLSTLER
jgi:glycosyltransferase involved in cell wall biosynthesis